MIDPTWPPQPAPGALRPEGLRSEGLRPGALRPEGLRPDGLRRLHDAMAARVANGELPGLVTLLARDDDVQVDAIGTYGFDDPRPMRRDTPFRLASLTKPVLAALTLRLAQEGLFELAEPVDRLLPELAGRRVLTDPGGSLHDTVAARRPITVEELLTFRLGIGISPEMLTSRPPILAAAEELHLVLADPDPRTPHPSDEWMRHFATLPLLTQPGERWHYNVGSLPLGVLLARAAGAPLAEVLRDRLLAPLGMTRTGFWTDPAQAALLPPPYMTDEETGRLAQRPVSPPQEWSRPPVFPSAAAGLLSTVDDYLVFARMLMNGGAHEGQQVLTAESVAAMTRNHLTPGQVAGAGMLLDGQGWGYGVAVAVSPDEVSPVPGRYGWSGGYGTAWFNHPQHRLIAIALSQTTDFLFNGALTDFSRLAVAAA